MMLKEFAYVLAVYEEGTISRAAKKLYISQPGLSQYIKALETSLGVPLIEYTDNRLVFTSAGLKYVQLAKQMVDMTDGLEEELAESSHAPYGSVSFGISSFWSSTLLPSILSYFGTNYPNVSLAFENDSEEILINKVLENKLRFALINLPLPPKELDFFPLFDEEVYFVASNNNAVIKAHYADSPMTEVVDLRLFRDEPFIFINRAPNIRSQVEKLCLAAGFTPQKTVNSDTVCLMQKLCHLNYGVTALPSILIERFAKAHDLKLLTLQEPKYRIQFAVAYRKNANLSRAENIFVQSLTKVSYNMHSHMFEFGEEGSAC